MVCRGDGVRALVAQGEFQPFWLKVSFFFFVSFCVLCQPCILMPRGMERRPSSANHSGPSPTRPPSRRSVGQRTSEGYQIGDRVWRFTESRQISSSGASSGRPHQTHEHFHREGEEEGRFAPAGRDERPGSSGAGTGEFGTGRSVVARRRSPFAGLKCAKRTTRWSARVYLPRYRTILHQSWRS